MSLGETLDPKLPVAALPAVYECDRQSTVMCVMGESDLYCRVGLGDIQYVEFLKYNDIFSKRI